MQLWSTFTYPANGPITDQILTVIIVQFQGVHCCAHYQDNGKTPDTCVCFDISPLAENEEVDAYADPPPPEEASRLQGADSSAVARGTVSKARRDGPCNRSRRGGCVRAQRPLLPFAVGAYARPPQPPWRRQGPHYLPRQGSQWRHRWR